MISISVLVFLISCIKPKPNENPEGLNILDREEVFISPDSLEFTDTVYVPIYSEIYTKTMTSNILLTATLSIRNTSFNDSLFVDVIDYYDSKGNKVKAFIEQSILLKPMASIEYVIEENDEVGGAGANFIIAYSSKSNDIKPICQSIMLGTLGQHAFAFTSDGISIKR